MKSIHSIRLAGFVSFPPRSASLSVQPLNVLIGPNASGKSNLIEAFEPLRYHMAPRPDAVCYNPVPN